MVYVLSGNSLRDIEYIVCMISTGKSNKVLNIHILMVL